MNTQNVGNRLLKISEVSRMTGACADTIRSWDRRGVLRAVRTAGGQRRFREGDVVALVAKGGVKVGAEGRRDREAAGNCRPRQAYWRPGGPSRTPPPVGGLPVAEEPELLEAQLEFEVLRAQQAAEVVRREMERAAGEDARRRQAELAAQEHSERLEELRAYGRGLASRLPSDWRAEVAVALERYVTVRNFPATLPEQEARCLVRARVQDFLDSYSADIEQEKQEIRDRWRVEALVEVGRRMISSATLGWDPRDAGDAEREIARELESEVSADWTESDVRELVEDSLAEWVEEDDRGDDQSTEGDY